MSEITVDHGVPSGSISVGQFVEQVSGVIEYAAFAVHVDDGCGDERIGCEVIFYGDRVGGAAVPEIFGSGGGLEEGGEGVPRLIG